MTKPHIEVRESPHSLEYGDAGYWVFFCDENGESVLSKCFTLAYAKWLAQKFRGDLRRGILLREDKSVQTR